MADGVKEKFEEILSRKEYQIYYEDTRSLWQRIKDWFQELIADILGKLFPALESTTNIAGIIVTVLVIALVIILGYVLYRVSRNRRLKRRYEQSPPLADLHEMDWTHEDHLEQANLKGDEGEYEQGIRHLFLGLLLYFHHIEWVEAQIWKTNWEYYAELKKVNKQSAKSFNELVLLFDQVTYGKRKVINKEYEQYKQAVLQSIDRANEQVNAEEE